MNVLQRRSNIRKVHISCGYCRSHQRPPSRTRLNFSKGTLEISNKIWTHTPQNLHLQPFYICVWFKYFWILTSRNLPGRTPWTLPYDILTSDLKSRRYFAAVWPIFYIYRYSTATGKAIDVGKMGNINEYRILYGIEWQTAFLRSRQGYSGVYSPCYVATREINTKITIEWTHTQFVTRVHTLFHFLYNISNP